MKIQINRACGRIGKGDDGHHRCCRNLGSRQCDAILAEFGNTTIGIKIKHWEDYLLPWLQRPDWLGVFKRDDGLRAIPRTAPNTLRCAVHLGGGKARPRDGFDTEWAKLLDEQGCSPIGERVSSWPFTKKLYVWQ